MRAKLKSALHLAVCQQIVFVAGCSGRAIHRAGFAMPRAQTSFEGSLKSCSRACSQVLVQQRLMHRPAILSLRSKLQDGGKPVPSSTGVEIPEEQRLMKKTLNLPVRVFSWTQGEDGVPFTEIIDVRSPAEYAEDHIPSAINLPCLDNEQHHAVGLLYASSPFEARKVGSAHVCRNVAAMLETHFRSKGKDYRPLIYCWRGGQRSGSVALILAEVGFRTSVLEGGYKHYRSRVQTGPRRAVA
jgi:rhodanese-related sulfurtransferase